MEKQEPDIPPREAAKRRDDALKRALNTPPKPKTQTDKGKPKKETAPPEQGRR